MSRCLRCGATSEWIEGRVPNEAVLAIKLDDQIDALRLQLSRAREWMEHLAHCEATPERLVFRPERICTCGLAEFLKELDHEH